MPHHQAAVGNFQRDGQLLLHQQHANAARLQVGEAAELARNGAPIGAMVAWRILLPGTSPVIAGGGDSALDWTLALADIAAHIDVELGIDPDELTNPWHAAISSAIAFTVGALLPLLAILLPPPAARIPITFVAVLLALGITGWMSARLGGADPKLATRRVVIGGAIAMVITYAIGRLVGGVV